MQYQNKIESLNVLKFLMEKFIYLLNLWKKWVKINDYSDSKDKY